jgi:hypothetical protein
VPGTASPAQLIAQFLVNQGVGSAPAGALAWPISVGFSPDGTGAQDSSITIYDTEGVGDGRILFTGEEINHPGVQVRVRAQAYGDGWGKMVELTHFLALLFRQTLTVGLYDYLVYNAFQVAPPASLGQEQSAKRRYLSTVNYLISLQDTYEAVLSEGGGSDSLEIFAHPIDGTILAADLNSFSKIHTNNGAGASTVRVTLPPAVSKLAGTFVQVDAGQFIIDPSGTEIFRTSTGDLTAGQAYKLARAVSKIRIFCYVAGVWVIEDESGTAYGE